MRQFFPHVGAEQDVLHDILRTIVQFEFHPARPPLPDFVQQRHFQRQALLVNSRFRSSLLFNFMLNRQAMGIPTPFDGAGGKELSCELTGDFIEGFFCKFYGIFF